MKKTFFPYLFLATFVLLIFWPATHFEFINFDDNVYVTANPHVLSGLNRENIQWAFTTNLGGHWHPLTWLSLQLDSTLFGINPKAFHLENILIHTLNTLLLSYLLFRFFKNPLLACLLAALFAIHPLRIESVVWITERKDVCSLFWGLMTLCLYERYQTQTKKFFYFLSLLAFTIALLFKPSVVILPMLILLIDYFIHIKKPNLTSLIPFLALSFFSSLITLYSQKQEGALKALHDISFSDRFTVSSMAYLSYLEKTFYPHALSVFYPLTLYPFYWGVLASLALISITLTGFFLRKKVPAFLFSWIWFVVAIFPVCGLFQVGGQAMADRWTYWPHVGIILGLGLYLHQSHFFKKYQQHILTGLVGLLLLLSYQTHLNMMYWKNSETLFTHALEVTQNNFLAHTNLGVALGQNGNQVAAQAHYEAALRIDPHYTEAINNLGGIYARQGNLTAAIPLFLEALEHNPADREARYNLGLAYYQTGQKIKALSTWLHLAIENPDYQPTWGSLSFVAQHDFASICEFKNQTPENIREDLDLMKHWLELWIPKANIPNLNESIKTLKQCIFK